MTYRPTCTRRGCHHPAVGNLHPENYQRRSVWLGECRDHELERSLARVAEVMAVHDALEALPPPGQLRLVEEVA